MGEDSTKQGCTLMEPALHKDQELFRLLDLAREFRDEIYRAMLTRPWPLRVVEAPIENHSRPGYAKRLRKHHARTLWAKWVIGPGLTYHLPPGLHDDPPQLAILLTNKQVYQQASEIFYSTNEFDFLANIYDWSVHTHSWCTVKTSWGFNACEAFLQDRSPTALRSLRCITLGIDEFCPKLICDNDTQLKISVGKVCNIIRDHCSLRRLRLRIYSFDIGDPYDHERWRHPKYDQDPSVWSEIHIVSYFGIMNVPNLEVTWMSSPPAGLGRIVNGMHILQQILLGLQQSITAGEVRVRLRHYRVEMEEGGKKHRMERRILEVTLNMDSLGTSRLRSERRAKVDPSSWCCICGPFWAGHPCTCDEGKRSHEHTTFNSQLLPKTQTEDQVIDSSSRDHSSSTLLDTLQENAVEHEEIQWFGL